MTARDPDNPFAPAQIVTTSALDWRDQVVIALGTEYRIDDTLPMLAGINYGRSPQPAQTTSSVFVADSRQHLTLGASYRFARQWRLLGGVEYVFPGTVRYNNAQQRFGDTALRGELMLFHLGASRVW